MYSFHLEDFEKWLAGFATKLEANLHDRVLTIPSRLGDGIIMARNVNPHFSYAIMNFRLTSDLEMRRESGSNGFIISFNQVEPHKESTFGFPSLPVADKKPFSERYFPDRSQRQRQPPTDRRNYGQKIADLLLP